MDINERASQVRGQRIAAAAVDYIIFQLLTLIGALIMVPFVGFDAIMDAIFGIIEGEAVNEAFIQYSIFTTLASLVIGVLYYGLIPAKKKGQTPGKMFLHLKAVDTEGGNLTFTGHLKRAIMIYGIYLGTPALVFIANDYTTYTSVNSMVSILTIGLVIVSVILLLTRPDARGVHDMIAQSYVVDEYFNLSENENPHKKEEDPLAFNYDVWEDKDDPWA